MKQLFSIQNASPLLLEVATIESLANIKQILEKESFDDINIEYDSEVLNFARCTGCSGTCEGSCSGNCDCTTLSLQL